MGDLLTSQGNIVDMYDSIINHWTLWKFWKFIENMYPKSKSWTLDTPAYATKNHYFYEKKCGFRKIDENNDQGEEWSSFVYHKIMD